MGYFLLICMLSGFVFFCIILIRFIKSIIIFLKKHLDSLNNIEEQIVDQQSEGIQFDANGKPIEKKKNVRGIDIDEQITIQLENIFKDISTKKIGVHHNNYHLD